MSEKNLILRSTTAVMAVILCSKLLGFLRQTVIAGVFGSNQATDIFFISSDFILSFSGAVTNTLVTALVTIFISISVKEGKESAERLLSRILTLFLLCAAILVFVLFLFAPTVGKIIAPAYDGAQLQILSKYLRIFSVAFIFTAFQSTYTSVLNANNIFVPGKLYGIVYNPIAIVLILLFGETMGIPVLFYSYYIANILYTLFLAFRSRKHVNFYFLQNLKDKNLRLFGTVVLPILLSNIIVQFNGVIDKAFCSLLGVGMASSYSYAFTLEQFVTGTFTTTLSMVLFSRFTAFAAEEKTEDFRRLLEKSVSIMLLLLTPVMIVTISCADDIASLVYMRGEFTAEAADYTAMALAGFAVGFPIIAMRELMIKVHFAFQETKKPVIIMTFTVLLNLLLSMIFSCLWGIFGITVATSLSSVLAVVLLIVTSRNYIGDFRFFADWQTYVKIAVAAVVCIICVVIVGRFFSDAPLTNTVLRIFLGCVVYFLALLILRCREVKDVAQKIKGILKY